MCHMICITAKTYIRNISTCYYALRVFILTSTGRYVNPTLGTVLPYRGASLCITERPSVSLFQKNTANRKDCSLPIGGLCFISVDFVYYQFSALFFFIFPILYPIYLHPLWSISFGIRYQYPLDIRYFAVFFTSRMPSDSDFTFPKM